MKTIYAMTALLCIALLLLMQSCTPPPDIATDCTLRDLEGTWLLENQSTWNEITLDAEGKVVGGDHPHGVESITGNFTITDSCEVEGAYTVQDQESLEWEPPMPPGTWAVTMIGYMLMGKQTMELDYSIDYTPQGGATETYTGEWYATKKHSKNIFSVNNE